MQDMVHDQSTENIMGREEGLRRALQSIENIAIHKEQSVSQKAKDIATGAGESDLRRLKRQFASLKNTYMLYDTKEHFLDGLLDGLPDGQEQEQLQELEEQVKAQGAKVKQNKKSTAEVQEQVSALVAKAAELHDELDRERAAAIAQLDRLMASSTALEGAKQQGLSELSEGPDEELCAETLAAEAALARELESSIASDEAQIAELAAAIKAEQGELQLLQAQLSEVEEAPGKGIQQQGAQGQASRCKATGEWCQGMQGVLAALSGVKVLRFEEDCIAVRLLTSFHASWQPTGDTMETIEHELTLALDATSATLAAAGLTPADADISDIVVAAQRGCGGFEFVVREVHARLATRLRRAALIRESDALYKLQPHDQDSESLLALLPQSGAEAELCVPLQWPTKGVPLHLKAIKAARDDVNLLQAMAVLQKRPELAYGSIMSLLQAIDEAISSIMATKSSE